MPRQRKRNNGEKTEGYNREGSRNYDLYIDVLYFSSTPSIFLFFCFVFVFVFFFIKASQCTQVDRKQMEHRYLVYSGNFIVFLIYIPVLSEQVGELTNTTSFPGSLPYL